MRRWILRTLAFASLALAGAGLPACGGDAKPVVQPDDHPPLPPASGTPIGYLIDDATELALRADQLVQLKAIDDDLAARLSALDAHAPHAASTTPSGSGGGRRGGGGGRHGGGGRRGGGGGAGAGSSQPVPSAASTDAANHNTEARADDVRDALARAFSVLDPAQQPIAKRVLTDRGVDLDAGRPTAPSGAATPAEPTEPDTGN